MIRILNSPRNFVRTDACAELGALVSEAAYTRGNLAYLFPSSSNFIPLCTFTVCIGTLCLGSARLDLLSLKLTISLGSSCLSFKNSIMIRNLVRPYSMANSHYRPNYTIGRQM